MIIFLNSLLFLNYIFCNFTLENTVIQFVKKYIIFQSSIKPVLVKKV